MSTTPSFPPGPKGLPFIGNLLDFQYSPLRFYRELQRNYGAMATIHIGKTPILFVFRPEHIRYFLSENPRNFVKPSVARGDGLKPLFGDGLLTIDGDMHRQQRKLVQPAFHKHRIDRYADTMTQFTQEMLDHWQPGAVVNIASELRQLTLRIITKTLFDVDSLEQARQLDQAFDTIIHYRPVRGLIYGISGSQQLPPKTIESAHIIDSFVYDLVAQRRAEDKDTGDVLSLLLTAQEEDAALTDKQVHDHVLTFVAAGHDTVQNTLTWTFYLLSKNPRVLAKLLAELQTVLAGRPPTLNDLPNLPYLEEVINESWRIYPPAWRQGRQALNDFELDGYHIPAKTITILSQWVVHNILEIWGDPENFRPERWDPTNGQKIPQGAYFPFGLGPHMCIGMSFAQLETKLLLATILQRYTPHLAPGARVAFQPLVVLRPKYGMLMRLEPSSN
jgi:cytochrome P450